MIYVKQWCKKNIYNIYNLVFVLVGYKIVTLTYDHGYLQLFMLNNGKRKSFITIRSSFFIMINYTMIT